MNPKGPQQVQHQHIKYTRPQTVIYIVKQIYNKICDQVIQIIRLKHCFDQQVQRHKKECAEQKRINSGKGIAVIHI